MYPLTNLMRFTFSLLIIRNQILKSKIRLNFLVLIGRNQYFYITFDHNEKINLALMYKNYIYIWRGMLNCAYFVYLYAYSKNDFL
jgi:hypothetical protein